MDEKMMEQLFWTAFFIIMALFILSIIIQFIIPLIRVNKRSKNPNSRKNQNNGRKEARPTNRHNQVSPSGMTASSSGVTQLQTTQKNNSFSGKHATSEETQKQHDIRKQYKNDDRLEPEAYELLLGKEPKYQTINYGILDTGEPVSWYVLDKQEERMLLLSEYALLFVYDFDVEQKVKEIAQIIHIDESDEESSFFLPNLNMVNQYLMGNLEILCKSEYSKEAWWLKENPLWCRQNEYVPWFLADSCESEEIISNNKNMRADPYYGGILYGYHWCISDIGNLAVPIDACFRDNVGGGGFYGDKYAIRPACWVKSEELG